MPRACPAAAPLLPLTAGPCGWTAPGPSVRGTPTPERACTRPWSCRSPGGTGSLCTRGTGSRPTCGRAESGGGWGLAASSTPCAVGAGQRAGCQRLAELRRVPLGVQGRSPPGYSRSGADEEGAHGAAAPAQGGQRGAVVAQLPSPALEVLLLEEHQPAVPVVLPPRWARRWHGCPGQRLAVGCGKQPGGGLWGLAPCRDARTGALTAQAMGRKEHILSTW